MPSQAIPVPEKRVSDFEALGFGMFIHYGLFSLLDRGEWAQFILYPSAGEEYDELFHQFTAEHFDAKAIVRTAKQAGMKYICLTTRHHEGFSLYDALELNDFDAPHSPAGRDLIREFVDACNEEGIVPFFYHTTLDWYEKSFDNDFSSYLAYLRRSVEILCTQYGKIGGLWFDGNWSKPDADWELDELYGLIRKYQPDAMIINNTGLVARGAISHPEIDSVTFEQGSPNPMDRTGMEKYVATEMCQTMNGNWGCAKNDYRYKSLPYFIEQLCACRRAGSNYLLNIGPNADGSIPNMQAAILQEIGNWMSIFGEAIIEGRPAGIDGVGKNFGLAGPDGKVYLFFHDVSVFGDENVTVNSGEAGTGLCTFTGVDKEFSSIRWMDNGEALKFIQNKDGHLYVDCPPHDYGQDYVVRVAVCEP
ncbi:MAG: alpha-L-fucosidase [Acutalibacteraceae bacterium]